MSIHVDEESGEQYETRAGFLLCLIGGPACWLLFLRALELAGG